MGHLVWFALFFVFLLYLCTESLSGRVGAFVLSENKLEVSVILFHLVGPSDLTQVGRPMVSIFTHRGLWLASSISLEKVNKMLMSIIHSFYLCSLKWGFSAFFWSLS